MMDFPAFVADRILPIPIRPDLTVLLLDLPHDMTKAEAQKIANIILAHAVSGYHK
jgi:hypothetical protein